MAFDYGIHYFRTKQTALGEAVFDVNPFYYLSQETPLGRRHDAKGIRQLSFATDAQVTADTPATVFIVSRIMGEDGVNAAVAGGSRLTNNGHYRLPARIRGDTWYYGIRTYTIEDTPNIEEVRMHYHQKRPRGRNR
jgi:hypothetical protein